MNHLTVQQLVDVYVNYEKYHYPPEAKSIAITILRERDVPSDMIESLIAGYQVQKQDMQTRCMEANEVFEKYNRFSILTVISYCGTAVIPILVGSLISRSSVVFYATVCTFVCAFLVFHIISTNLHLRLRYILKEETSNPTLNIIFHYFFVIPFSPILLIHYHFYYRKAIRNLESTQY